MTVVEDVLVGGVQAGLDAVPHHVSRSGGALQLQDLQEAGKFGRTDATVHWSAVSVYGFGDILSKSK